MAKHPPEKPENAKLRRRAEQKLKDSHSQSEIQDADTRRLLHELQVHQIELEMQNEELKKAREQAEVAAMHYTELYDFAPLSYFTLGRGGNIQQSNLTGATLLGVDRSKLIGRPFRSFIDSEHRLAFKKFLERVFASQNNEVCELMMKCKGDELCIMHAEAIADTSGVTCRMVATNITERKRNEIALEIAASVHQAIGEAVMIADAENRIITINPAFTRVTGYEHLEAVGKFTNLLKSGRQDSLFYQRMWQVLGNTGHWQGEIWNRRKNGEIYPEWLSIHTIYDENRRVLRRVALFSDITDQKRSEEIIWNQANYDVLTGLPNRRLFRDRLEQEMKKSERTRLPLALLFIDLDQFKEVNDTLGHDKGDILLIEAAQRIAKCVRESDTVARLGGDEFTVILSELEDGMDRVNLIAQGIVDKMVVPFQLGEDKVFLSASIGIALYPFDADKVDDLLKDADQAMYVAKNTGRNRYYYFTHTLQEAAETRMRLINDLRGALNGDQFRVYYQPIIELETGTINKAEALIRWQHPDRGLVYPAEFIPLAEETGMIIEIGDWVFKEAAKQVKRMRDGCCQEMQISVNKSPVQFHAGENNIESSWLTYLNGLGLCGQSITVEITESLLLDISGKVTAKLNVFRDEGIQVALDDFGTGYSALSYLKKFHIDYLKIDQSFVRGVENDVNDVALCEAIIAMAHKLGIKVIAEGVETEAQLEFLKAAGCDYAQGYLFSRPVPAEELELLLKEK